MIYLFPVLLLLICLGFWAVQAHMRRGRAAFVDVGWVFMMVLLIYGIVPALGFLLAHLGIGQILDQRLPAGFDWAIVEEVQLIFLCFAASFAIAYTCTRRFAPPGVRPALWRFVWRRSAQAARPRPDLLAASVTDAAVAGGEILVAKTARELSAHGGDRPGGRIARAEMPGAAAVAKRRHDLSVDESFDATSHTTANHRPQALRQLPWLVLLTAGMMIALAMVSWLFGREVSGDYASSYVAFRSMPLVVQQLLGIATQTLLSLLIATIVLAVAAWPAKHFLVATLVGCFLVYASLAGGSRSTAFLCFFAYLVATTVYVPGFSISKVVVLGGVALGLFMFAGLLRDQMPDETSFGLLQSGEFTSVFINAIDLPQRLNGAAPTDSWLAFYFVDLLRLLPSQLVGSVKFDPASWYVQTFYEAYYEQGGGLAFGTIAESTIGLGAPEAAVRGALLGLAFAWLANRLIEGPGSVTRVFVYVWLTVLSYQSIRDTTFSLAARALFQLLPLVGLLVLTRHIRFCWKPNVLADAELAGGRT